MTFVTVSDNREQLALLSQFLVTLIPGCTIHQNSDPMRAIRCLSCQKVDAVFADADTCVNVMDMLHKLKTQAKLCLLCRQGIVLPKEMECVHGVLSYPLTEQKCETLYKEVIRTP